ncbi:unnamed protein product [Pedinophyceae sp. YPF-701]|nr:unnamed protein product [Pedinophyceae sp. YPF-701]
MILSHRELHARAFTLLRGLSRRVDGGFPPAWSSGACASAPPRLSWWASGARGLSNAQPDAAHPLPDDDVADTLRVARLVESLRNRGHLVAQLDPLRRVQRGPWLEELNGSSLPGSTDLLPLLEAYPQHGTPDEKARFLADALGLQGPTDASRKFYLDGYMRTLDGGERAWWTLPQVFEYLGSAYCGTATAEIGHLHTVEQQNWLSARMENRAARSPNERRETLKSLLKACLFEKFLGANFPASKRFSLEGCDAFVPGLEALLTRCRELGVTRVEMGMAHRGRLNVLHNVLQKPMGMICSEMNGDFSEFHVGDVKYHMGEEATLLVRRSPEARYFSGRMIQHADERAGGAERTLTLSLAPNPSHLEAVSPVILGMVRAQQTRMKEHVGRQAMMGLLVHGDAAFSGLGSVMETLNLSDVPGFSTGGTVHIVINNQVGFTTVPSVARSALHCTDIAKTTGAAILHANADDPDGVAFCCEVAAEFRSQFSTDVVVDITGYRRHGHNELEDPRPTMPNTYDAVSQHTGVTKSYGDRLLADGVVTEEEIEQWRAEIMATFEEGLRLAKEGAFEQGAGEYVQQTWQGDALASILDDDTFNDTEPTGLPVPTLQWVGRSLTTPPPRMHLHPDTEKLLQKRRRMIEGDKQRIDWGMAEALAFGTLALHRGVLPPGVAGDDQYFEPSLGLNKGHYKVRLTGQDVERGTFNHRHAVLHDIRTGEQRMPLNMIAPGKQETIEVHNSPLSENGPLGFEYGFSLGMKKRGLTIWEAQFGDFANNAQVVIDQFISSGEEKWGTESGLVVLLPHGLDGQGPDHSSARIERYLQMVADDPDHLPGNSPSERAQIRATFESLAAESGTDGVLQKDDIARLLDRLGLVGQAEEMDSVDHVWRELGLTDHLDLDAWMAIMTTFLRRQHERRANMFVVNCTTPAQYFHVLRRQVNRSYLKPLIVAAPKFLLHHTPCTSDIQDFAPGTFFHRVIDDGSGIADNTRHRAYNPTTGESYLYENERIRRVILCTGQVYYSLSRLRQRMKVKDIALVRLEQIAPFPHDRVTRVIARYPNAELAWVQEEPKNMGAWMYVKDRLRASIDALCSNKRDVHYVGRPPSASPATASMGIHLKETREVLEAAFQTNLRPDND